MNYNPYDLVPLLLNGHATYGRPVEFDSVITNHKTMTNAFGNIMKPTKVSTTCPDCGQGYTLDIECGEPPFEVIEISCPICKPQIAIPETPFIDPVAAGVVGEHEINPELTDIKTGIKEETSTVAERITKDINLKSEGSETGNVKAEESQHIEVKAKEPKKEKEKAPAKPKPSKTVKEPKEPKKPTKKSPVDKKGEEGFIDYGKKRELPKAEEMLPEVDLDMLED